MCLIIHTLTVIDLQSLSHGFSCTSLNNGFQKRNHGIKIISIHLCPQWTIYQNLNTMVIVDFKTDRQKMKEN